MDDRRPLLSDSDLRSSLSLEPSSASSSLSVAAGMENGTPVPGLGRADAAVAAAAVAAASVRTSPPSPSVSELDVMERRERSSRMLRSCGFDGGAGKLLAEASSSGSAPMPRLPAGGVGAAVAETAATGSSSSGGGGGGMLSALSLLLWPLSEFCLPGRSGGGCLPPMMEERRAPIGTSTAALTRLARRGIEDSARSHSPLPPAPAGGPPPSTSA